MKCLTYQERRKWLRRLAWKISGAIMALNSIDRIGVLDEPAEIKRALAIRERGEGDGGSIETARNPRVVGRKERLNGPKELEFV